MKSWKQYSWSKNHEIKISQIEIHWLVIEFQFQMQSILTNENLSETENFENLIELIVNGLDLSDILINFYVQVYYENRDLFLENKTCPAEHIINCFTQRPDLVTEKILKRISNEKLVLFLVDQDIFVKEFARDLLITRSKCPQLNKLNN